VDKEVLVVTPCGFDGEDPADRAEFAALAYAFADVVPGIEPFATALGDFSVQLAFDFAASAVPEGSCWYNGSVIQAAGSCPGWTHVLAINHDSGEAGGSPGVGLTGDFSMAGSGTPAGCDTSVCDGDPCPPKEPPFNCSWSYATPFSLLHETAHTLGALGHTCFDELGDQGNFGQPGQSPANCAEVGVAHDTVPCAVWDVPEFHSWVQPGDPPFGCYPGCDGQANWFRPWDPSGIMCRDDFLEVGFTPVDRKILHDQLYGGCAALEGAPCGVCGFLTCVEGVYLLCDDECAF